MKRMFTNMYTHLIHQNMIDSYGAMVQFYENTSCFFKLKGHTESHAQENSLLGKKH